MIPTKTVTEILQTAQIDEVIGEYVQLRRRGINLVGLCPFHQEKTPSFSVSTAKNIFKCFGCGQAGNAVKFVMEHQQISFPEALRILAKKYGITIEEKPLTPALQLKMQAEESLFLLNQAAQKFYQNNLFANDENGNIQPNYFKHRGYFTSTIEKWGLGLSSSSNGFTQQATQNGYRAEQLQQLGLTTKTGNDFFRNRAMFPIHNLWGKIIGFAGRIVKENQNAPKYLNSPESSIYQKSQILYGTFFAKKAMRQKEECLLAEGYTDVISLHQAGIENVVASAGTSLTIGQINLIKRFTQNVTLLYDGDAAGFRAATRGLDLILQKDMNVKIVVFPQGEDPDSYLRQVGTPAFQTYLQKETRDFILLKTRLLKRDAAGNPSQKAALIQDLLTTINQIPDAIKHALYLKECATILNIEERILVQQAKQIQQTQKNHLRKILVKNKPIDISQSTDYLQEANFVRFLLKFGTTTIDTTNETTIADYLLTNIEDVLPTFDHLPFRFIVEKYQEIAATNAIFVVQDLLDILDKRHYELAANLLDSNYAYQPGINYTEYAQKLIQQIKLQKIGKLIAENQARIDGEGEEKKLQRYLKVHGRLLKMKQVLAKELGVRVLGENLGR